MCRFLLISSIGSEKRSTPLSDGVRPTTKIVKLIDQVMILLYEKIKKMLLSFLLSVKICRVSWRADKFSNQWK